MFICQKQPMTDILCGGVPQTDTYYYPTPKARLGQLKRVPNEITCKMLSTCIYVKNNQWQTDLNSLHLTSAI